ncbi:hypothetical protein ACTMS0_26640 [Micromonospora sp. H33]
MAPSVAAKLSGRAPLGIGFPEQITGLRTDQGLTDGRFAEKNQDS